MPTVRIHILGDGEPIQEWDNFSENMVHELMEKLGDPSETWVSVPSGRGTLYFFRQHVTLVEVLP